MGWCQHGLAGCWASGEVGMCSTWCGQGMLRMCQEACGYLAYNVPTLALWGLCQARACQEHKHNMSVRPTVPSHSLRLLQ